MKKVAGLILCLLLVLPNLPVYGMTIFEASGVIEGSNGVNYEFTADDAPYNYVAFLEDQSEAPLTGFDFLFMSITTATETLGSTTGPGFVAFEAVPHETYFANIFGTGNGCTQTGLYSIKVVNTVAEPATLLFLTAGLIALAGWKRKLAMQM